MNTETGILLSDMDGNINNMNKLDYDTEYHVLEDVNELMPSECSILSDNENSSFYFETIKVLEKIINSADLRQWKDNASLNKSPDIINAKDKLAMEIMRIDDHSPDGKKNPYKAKARKAIKNLNFGDKARITTSLPTDLPTDEDHNYKNLYTSFQRTMRKHISKLKIYKSNYPDSKIIFLVVNETSGIYLEMTSKTKPTWVCAGRPHLFFCDNRFLNEFINTDLDYLIMYSPYCRFKTATSWSSLPELVILDVKRLANNKNLKRIDYDESRMISSEI